MFEENKENRENKENIEQLENVETQENAVQAINFEEELIKQKEYYLRIIADYEDRMRRCKQDASHAINIAIENFTRDLIPLVGDIAQALTICDGPTRLGLEMIEKNLKNTLKKHGIEEIVAEVGQDFDPNLHHAISTVEQDGFDEGKIVSIVQRGYRLNNKVINATMVVVAK